MASLALPAAAGAHVVVSPGTVFTEASQTFELRVPTEGSSPTARVALTILRAVTFYAYEPVRGWRVTPQRTRTGRVYRLLFRGRLGVGQFQRFAFRGAAPEQPTTLSWRAVQTYRNGEVVRWTGAPESRFPASQTVVEAAPPEAGS